MTNSPLGASTEMEFQVVRRPRDSESAPWKLVRTERGGGRAFRSPAAAKALITRELKDSWNYGYQYKIQWRPVTTEWSDYRET